MSKCIQPNDRYCPQCGVDTLRHAPDGTEYYGAHTQETCLEIRLARAQERAEKAEHDAIGYKVVRDRYAQWAMEWEARYNQLRTVLERVEWVKPPEDHGDLGRWCPTCRAWEAYGHDTKCPFYGGKVNGILAGAPANPYAAVVEAYRMLVDLATRVRKEPENVREWLRRDGIVISDLTDKDQHAVFLMYNHLVDLSVRAKNLLESFEENDALADLVREESGEWAQEEGDQHE